MPNNDVHVRTRVLSRADTISWIAHEARPKNKNGGVFAHESITVGIFLQFKAQVEILRFIEIL